jgi:Domain of unknown function(DUF2779)
LDGVRLEIPALSKSRFLAGLQCHKRLYLECYARDLGGPPDDVTRAVFEAGRAIGALARTRYPGGRLVTEDHLHHQEAEQRTRTVLADESVLAVYEAAFTFDDVRIRADILARTGTGVDLVEVKSTARVKPEHAWDLAIQLHVLHGAGLTLRRACLMHLNPDYVYPGGEYDLEQLFVSEDLSEHARGLGGEVRTALAAMREPLWSETPPAIPTGRHCTAPRTCAFYEHCHVDAPEHPIHELPRLRKRLRERLVAMAVADIREVPENFSGLSPLQLRVLDAVRTGTRFHDSGAATELARLRFPIHFLDFETFGPPLPLYPGTRPYQAIPFQWSDHILNREGEILHRQFLHEGRDDPRCRFAETLLQTLEGQGSIIVYSGYEDMCLARLEIALPNLTTRLREVRSRLFDLLPVVRRHVYDPRFHGSYSIKAVLPALVPGLGYEDLAIKEGSLASIAYAEILAPGTPLERVMELRTALRAYCKRDTEAMVELYRLLRT